MDRCPRCSSRLERLELDDVTTVACDQCGYADVPVEHAPAWETPESWRDALKRFYEREFSRK